MRRSGSSDPQRGYSMVGDRPVVAWLDENGKAHDKPAGPALLGLGLERAVPIRESPNFPHRRNYEGLYWCAGSGEHVGYESMTEYSSLMLLDHMHELVAVAAQPMCIHFPDGMRHYPDYLLLHRGGGQEVIDVRELEEDDAESQVKFDRTADVCRRIGWNYRVVAGPSTRAERHNLEWLAAYRHPYQAPEPVEADRILAFLTKQRVTVKRPRTLRRLVCLADPHMPIRALPAVYHLMWRREIHANLNVPLSWGTIVRRGTL
jgi:hypothetical protein